MRFVQMRARNTTLQNLILQVDARSLIDPLGYSGLIIAQHAARAGRPDFGLHHIRHASDPA
jgi:hypothetical protein